LDYLVWQ